MIYVQKLKHSIDQNNTAQLFMYR